MKEMVAFFLSKGIVKGGELIIYLFIFCCDLFLLACWCFCFDCCCCCLFVSFWCFLCFMLPPGFKQALHNKPPTHLGGNYSRIVIQPRDNCHNRDLCGTSYSKRKTWYFLPHCPQYTYHGPHQRLDHNYNSCKWRWSCSRSLCPVWSIHTRSSFSVSTRRYLSNIDNQQTLKRQKTEHKQLEIECNSAEFNRPFYNYGWKRGWSGPCFDTTISAFLICKSFFFFILTSTF